MRYCPQPENRRLSDSLLFACLITATVVLSLPAPAKALGLAVGAPLLFGLLSLPFWFGGLYCFMRYRLLSFTYEIGYEDGLAPALSYSYDPAKRTLSPIDTPYALPEGDLVVTKRMGRSKPFVDCRLSLANLTEVIPLDRKGGPSLKELRRSRAKQGEPFALYDYTLSFHWRRATLLLFSEGEGSVGILLEIPADLLQKR